jgi:hypothetical protein
MAAATERLIADAQRRRYLADRLACRQHGAALCSFLLICSGVSRFRFIESLTCRMALNNCHSISTG